MKKTGKRILALLLVLLLLAAPAGGAMAAEPDAPALDGQSDEEYARSVMNTYLSKNITAGMSDYEKLDVITAFSAKNYDYHPTNSTYTTMIKTGAGSCYASTDAIVYMCEQVGLKAHWRYGVNDAYSGDMHRNAAVQIGSKIYIADAGYSGSAPRKYGLWEENSGFYVSSEDGVTATLLQYDGFRYNITVPPSVPMDGPPANYGQYFRSGEYVTITAIGSYAFYYGEEYSGMTVKSVTLPETVATIGDHAFYGCGSMTSVTIPASVTRIKYAAFAGCDSLTDVYYGGTRAQWDAITKGGGNSALTAAVIHCSDSSSSGSETTGQQGWKYSGGHWYYYKNGSRTTGWLQYGGVWYYLGAGGAMVTGWKQIGGRWYFFGSSGAMQTGWLRSGGSWYYLGSDGAMVTGWQEIGGRWYSFMETGAMRTGWYTDYGCWFWLGSGGAVATGWRHIGGAWYSFTDEGIMRTGWQFLGSNWYYFSADGAMQTGWLQADGHWYYLKRSGAMAWNETLTINGKRYSFDTEGVML